MRMHCRAARACSWCRLPLGNHGLCNDVCAHRGCGDCSSARPPQPHGPRNIMPCRASLFRQRWCPPLRSRAARDSYALLCAPVVAAVMGPLARPRSRMAPLALC